MQECDISNRVLKIFLFIYFLTILTLAIITPFTHSEANILFFKGFTFEGYILKYLYSITDKPIILRAPFILISILSLYLFMNILKEYFKVNSKYFNLSIFIYLLIPGIFLSYIIVTYATISIFLTLLLIYSYNKRYYTISIISLVLLFFTHNAQFVVYIAITLYSYKDKNWLIFTTSSILLLFTSIEATYPIDGIPKGHLMQLFGIYAAIFSPLYLIATIYAIYKIALNNKKDLLWYITTTAFVISILLSLRQKIKITDFAPYFIISTPLVVTIFKNSVEIRLKEFRKNYYIVCNIILIVLLLETLTVAFHYPLYKLNPNNRIVIDKSIYIIPDIVKKLKKNGIKCKKDISNKEKNLYQYYKINLCR